MMKTELPIHARKALTLIRHDGPVTVKAISHYLFDRMTIGNELSNYNAWEHAIDAVNVLALNGLIELDINAEYVARNTL